jgi:hypothetical protein
MRWSVRHDRAVIALLSEPTIQEASLTSRVSRATITRWLNHPVFRAKLDKAWEELFIVAKASLLGAAPESVGTLQEVMRNVNSPPTARVAAARAVLALCVRVRELELAAKLDRMEEEADGLLGEVIQ